MSLQVLREWVPEIAGLAKATRDASVNHANSAEFYQQLVKTSTWQGQAAQEAMLSMLMSAAAHNVRSEDLSSAATAMDHAEQDATALATTVKAILDDAAAAPAVEVDQTTNKVSVPANYDYLDDETKLKVSKKIADLEARIADAQAEGDRIDADLAKAIAKATGLPEPTKTPTTLAELLGLTGEGPLAPGEVRNMGPIAGTDSPDAIPGIRAADLGEVITLPDGTKVAIFGDSYANPQVGGPGNEHYPSVAVPVTFDKNGKPHFGAPLTGTNLNSGSPNESPGPHTLFPIPDAARAAGANNALPAGSVKIGNDTYMMVVGTNTSEGLSPKGSWLVKVTNDPAAGWKPIEGSYRSVADNPTLPTQFSGYQGSDGKVYIAADAFDRSQGVSMYRVDPAHISDRGAWEPYDPIHKSWGAAGTAAPMTITPPDQHWGEISFREVDGKPVLSGTNMHNTEPGGTSAVEVHVGNSPTSVVSAGPPTVVMNNAPGAPNNVPAPYGGYILPGSTLDNLGLFGSQWYQPSAPDGHPVGPVHYDVQDIHVNVKPGQR